MNTINSHKKISEIQPICTGSVNLYRREDLSKYIEEPCLAACSAFFDKNIQTYMCSANYKNVGNNASITVEYDTLSVENQKICQHLLDTHVIDEITPATQFYGRQFELYVPVNNNATVQEISDQLLQLASNFQEQDVLFGRMDLQQMFDYLYDEKTQTLSLEYTRPKLNIVDNSIAKEDLIKIAVNDCGYFYNAAEQIFWKDKSLYLRHKNYLEKQKKKEALNDDQMSM